MSGPVGLELFINAFQSCKSQFVLIGGMATYLATEEAGLPFARTTRDLDIVLIVEALDLKFAKHFWSFIKAGAYENKMKGDDGRQFYRFSLPKTPGYPKEIELFSRKQNVLVDGEPGDISPIAFDDEVSSLSAILLDEDYYELIRKGLRDGICWADASTLIPLKAKAWLDLRQRSQGGLAIDSKKIRKHLRDVVLLLATMPENQKIAIPASIQGDIKQFLDQAGKEELDLKGLGYTRDVTYLQVLEQLRAVFLQN